MSLLAVDARFDRNVATWEEAPGYNQRFLQNQQEWATIQCQRQGHLFLNEVFDLLMIPRTGLGQTVGWLHDHSFRFVDFGFARDGEFLAGYTKDVNLMFMVQEDIHLKI